MDSSLLLSFIFGLLTGILTHLFYRWVDEKRTRERLREALKEELQTNLKILERQIEGIEQSDINYIYAEKVFSTYHAEAFHILRTTNPKLYSSIIRRSKLVIEAYQNLFLLNELRSKILQLTLFRDHELPTTLANFQERLKELLTNIRNLINSTLKELNN